MTLRNWRFRSHECILRAGYGWVEGLLKSSDPAGGASSFGGVPGAFFLSARRLLLGDPWGPGGGASGPSGSGAPGRVRGKAPVSGLGLLAQGLFSFFPGRLGPGLPSGQKGVKSAFRWPPGPNRGPPGTSGGPSPVVGP